MNPHTILLATDMSANAAFAARWAASYAKVTGAKVILAHIIEINLPNWVHDAYNVLEDEEKLATLKNTLLTWYETHAHTEADGVIVATGNMDEELGDLVAQVDAELLVLAKSGKSALTRFFAGSTAQMMAANPPCAVAIVHPDHTHLDDDTKLLVATDLSDAVEHAITGAASMAAALDAHLDIIHATTFSGQANSPVDLPDSLKPAALKAAADEQMKHVLANHEEFLNDIEWDAHIIDGHPVDTVAHFAGENDINVAFVGNATSYNLITNVFGRVSLQLMQLLPCTLVVVPPHADLVVEHTEEE